MTTVPVASPDDDDRVVGIVRPGYRIGDDILRPAMVAVGKRTPMTRSAPEPGSSRSQRRVSRLAGVRGSPARRRSSGPSGISRRRAFRIVGNIHYVGTNELAAYLLTTPDGHILIDGGLPESAPLIERSIRTARVQGRGREDPADDAGAFRSCRVDGGAGVGVRRAGDGDGRRPGDRRAGGKGDYLFGDTRDVPANEGGARAARRRAGDASAAPR